MLVNPNALQVTSYIRFTADPSTSFPRISYQEPWR
jgi:hypothetical protein